MSTSFSDWLPVIALVVTAAVVIWFGVIRYGRRSGALAASMVAASLNVVCAVGHVGLGGGHLSGVLAKALRGGGFDGAGAFKYDFHFYSLILLGLALSVPGLLCLLQVRALTRGEAHAWKITVGLALALLTVNGLLIPASAGFSVLLASLAGGNLLGLAAARRLAAPRHELT